MPIDLFDTNSRDENYKFNLSDLTEKEWTDFALELIFQQVGRVRNVSIKEFRVRINNNLAKINLEYQGNKYHVLKLYLNEFGIVGECNNDVISSKFQELMSAHFGADYQNELQNLNNLNN